jgi:frataxin-like iron-binding protein CyaY
MKKIVTIVFAWVASLGLIGLSLFLGMEYTKLSAQASQDLKSDLQALGDFDLDRALSETTLTLNPAESELIMNAFLDRNPQVLELRLSIPRAMALDTQSEGSDIITRYQKTIMTIW